MDIPFKPGKMGHMHGFPDQGFMTAVLDDRPLMTGNSAKMAVPETAPVAGQTELHFMQGRYAAAGIVIGMPPPCKRQFIDGIHFFRRKGQSRRSLDDITVFRWLYDRPAIERVLLLILYFKGSGKCFFVFLHFFIGRAKYGFFRYRRYS